MSNRDNERQPTRMRRPGAQGLTGAQKRQGTAFLLIIGLGFTLYGGFMVMQALDSNSWPSVTGEVLESYVTSSQGGSQGGTTYKPFVVYEYVVGGTTYKAAVVKLGDTSSSSIYSTHQKVVDKYPVGASVIVFYDPEDPQNAALETGLNFVVLILFGIGLAMIGGFFVMKKKGDQQDLNAPMDQNSNQNLNAPIEP